MINMGLNHKGCLSIELEGLKKEKAMIIFIFIFPDMLSRFDMFCLR